MFDVGFWELSLIAVLGLMILGPERLPKVVRTLSALMRKARSTWAGVRAEIDRELATDELREQLREPLQEMRDLEARMGDSFDAKGKSQSKPTPSIEKHENSDQALEAHEANQNEAAKPGRAEISKPDGLEPSEPSEPSEPKSVPRATTDE